MSETKISAEVRTDFGKGAARSLRRANQVPAVIYGHGTEPVHVALPAHATMMALKHANALLDIDINGKATLTLPKDVQRNALKGNIEHVDLLIVKRGEKVQVEVPVHVSGTAANNTVVTNELVALLVECEATHIPGAFEVNIDKLPGGTQIHAGQIELPKDVTLVTDPEATVVNIAAKGGGSDAAESGEEAAGEEAAE